MDNVAPKTLHYYNDTWRRLLAEATSTLSFTVDKTGLEAETFLTEKNYLSFKHNDKQYLFSIMKTEETEHTINVYAENLNLELLHETIAPIDMTVSHDLVWYLNEAKIIKGGGLVVGTNEVSDQTRKIKLESKQTALARLLSIANNFGAEVEFSTFLNNDGSFNKMVVNFYKKYDGNNQGVGTNRQDVTLYYGKNVEGITRIVDKTELFTQITPTGKDGLSIVGIEKIEYDENGNIEFFSPKSLSSIYAPQASEMYPSQLLTEDNNYINHQYAADGTSNVETLYSLALNELKKYVYPAITYEVTGFYDLDIGDTVKIQDDKFAPVLLIQTRVAEQSICFSDPTKNKTTFGNILALESRVSQDLTGRLKELVEQAIPYRFEIVSDNGLTFKNSTGSTTLTARVFKGSNVDEVSADSFEWLLDGVSFGGTAKSQLVSASQVTGTAVVRYNAKIGDIVIGGVEVTLQDVSDGANGISPTVTINPDTSLTIVDAQGTSTTPALKGANGADGTSGIIVSSVAPSSPQNGQLWQDTSTTPQLVKKWTGSEWVIWELYAINLKADNISTISLNLGDMTGGTVKLMDDVAVGDTLKKYGIYQSKLGLLSSGPALATSSTLSNSQMGVANLSKGELRFMVTDYTENLKDVQDAGISDANHAFIKFDSYDNGKDVMLIGSSGDIVFKGITSQDTPWKELINGTFYKNMFSRVYISYSIKATSTANVNLGTLPVGLRPPRNMHLIAPAWGTNITNDRHIEILMTGQMTLYNPVNGADYFGEVSFTL